MKKGKKIAIVVLIVLAIIYFGVKGFLLWSLPSSQSFLNKSETIEAFNKKDAITIKKTISSEEDYFYYEGLKIRNDFEIFDKEHNVYKIKNTDIRVVFDKHPIDDLVTYVKEEVKNMGMYYDLTKDLEKNNINTDYKLYEYLYESLNPRLNLFSSINKFRKAHAVDLAAMLVTVGFNKFTLINGDYDGYILQMNGAKEAIINHNNYKYCIRIYGSEYTNESLYNLLSTIIFE